MYGCRVDMGSEWYGEPSDWKDGVDGKAVAQSQIQD